MNAELPYVDKLQFGEFGDEAGAGDEYVVSRLLLECDNFVLKVFGGQSGIAPGDILNGVGKENFRGIFDCVGKVVHVFIPGGASDDGRPEIFHELVGGAAV